jgi:hypothetical protein
MSQQLPHYERDRILWQSQLPGTSKLMLLAMNSFMANSDECWPGYDTLAEMCGLTRRTSIKLVEELEELKAIHVSRTTKRKPGSNKQPSNRYKIRFDNIPKISQGEISALRDRVKKLQLQGEEIAGDRVKKLQLQGEDSSPELSIELLSKNDQLNKAEIAFENEQPAAIPPGQVQGISQASPVKRIEAAGEGECSAAAPHPGNFERTRYGKAPSPIMSHYGMGYMVAGRDGVNLRFEPRIIRGMRKIGQNWPGDTALTSDGKAIAYIRKMLSQLTQPQHFEAAWARLELAWEEGGESAVIPMHRKSQWEELQEQYGSPLAGGAA